MVQKHQTKDEHSQHHRKGACVVRVSRGYEPLVLCVFPRAHRHLKINNNKVKDKIVVTSFPPSGQRWKVDIFLKKKKKQTNKETQTLGIFVASSIETPCNAKLLRFFFQPVSRKRFMPAPQEVHRFLHGSEHVRVEAS